MLLALTVAAQEPEAPAEPAPSDSLAPDSLSRVIVLPPPLALTLRNEALLEFDKEEFGDWVRLLPGYYPLDRAGYASADRGLMLGAFPTMELYFRGRRLEDHLLGAPELGWVPPEALASVTFAPLPLGAPGAQIVTDLLLLDPTPPASRISVRDGFYGLGTVDFDLTQKITPAVTLNGGGRVATFGGRLPNNEGYGLNLRAETVFETSPGLWGWGGVMQNRLNSQVPFTEVDHNRVRYDGDLALNWRGLTGHLYGFQQRETYGPGNDAWHEGGLILRGRRQYAGVDAALEARAALARWRLKGQAWSNTSFGGARADLQYRPVRWLAAQAHLGLELSDEFAPAAKLGASLEAPADRPVRLFAAAARHQRFPSRFELQADYAPGEHFLPYDPAFYQFPELAILGQPGLTNETYTTAQAGVRLESAALRSSVALFRQQVDDPIRWRAEGDGLRAYNAAQEERDGVLGWAQLFLPYRLEFGATGSWVPRDEEEQSLYPEVIAHAWGQYSQPLFENHLVMRLRVWEDYWGVRQFPVPGGWDEEAGDFILSARISASLLGVHLFWGVNNILDRKYELVPGLPLMHKEEVWGVVWNFRD